MTIVFAALVTASGPVSLALKGYDPVDLVSGREVKGRPEISAVSGRHEYRFCSEEHRTLFKATPHSYAVQNGGACGKMGALSGHGSPDRWAVVNGRIFLFASEGCRTAFLARKDAYFTPPDEPPKADAEEAREAQALFDRMVQSHGGKEALSAIQRVEWGYETPYEEKGDKRIWHTKIAYLGPDRYAHWEGSGEDPIFFVRDGATALEGTTGATYDVHPGERRALTAKVIRHPVAILLGGAGKPLKKVGNDGFVMARGDIVLTVRLDPTSGRLASVEYRDAYLGPVSSVIVEYGGYEVHGGVAFPRSHRVKVDGAEWGKQTRIANLVVNGAIPAVFSSAKE